MGSICKRMRELLPALDGWPRVDEKFMVATSAGTFSRLLPFIERLAGTSDCLKTRVPFHQAQSDRTNKMAINPVTGLFSRAVDLYKFLTEHRDHLDRSDAKPASPAETPAAPAEPPARALHHPRSGSRRFLSTLMRPIPRKMVNTGQARAQLDSHKEVPGAAVRRNEHKTVEPIPANDRAGVPIQPQKTRSRPHADALADGQRMPAKMATDDPRWNGGVENRFASMPGAAKQRVNVLMQLQRKLGNLPFLRL